MERIHPALVFELKVIASDVDAIRRKLDERKFTDVDDLSRHLSLWFWLPTVPVMPRLEQGLGPDVIGTHLPWQFVSH